MTIGIAASGPCAGLAVFRALAAVERVATGAIGGYAVFTAIDANGVIQRAATQRGGSQTLFVDGECTGVEPPEAVATAKVAGVISSGPDRPEPLERHLPALAGIGLVTGHRLPNTIAGSGQPLNLAVLQRLSEGADARSAIERVLADEPDADAGLIAVDAAGTIYAANSERVQRRPDLGHGRRENLAVPATVEVLHNAIFPIAPLADLAACIAMDTMCPPLRVDGYVTVDVGTPVTLGGASRVHIDAKGRALRIESTDRRIVEGHHNCAAIYLGAKIVRGEDCIGETIFEPNAVVVDGCIVTLNGQQTMNIAYRGSGQ